MNKADRLRQMYDRVKLEELAYHNAVREAYPVDTSISWIKNSRCAPQFGRVLRHAYADGLVVKNGHTGKEVHITFGDVYQAYEHYALTQEAKP